MPYIFIEKEINWVVKGDVSSGQLDQCVFFFPLLPLCACINFFCYPPFAIYMSRSLLPMYHDHLSHLANLYIIMYKLNWSFDLVIFLKIKLCLK